MLSCDRQMPDDASFDHRRSHGRALAHAPHDYHYHDDRPRLTHDLGDHMMKSRLPKALWDAPDP